MLNPVFWPEVRRGSERFARELADGLIARGHRVTLICGAPRASRTVEDGMTVVRVPRLGGAWLAGRLDRRRFEEHLTHLPLALRALHRAAPDVAHALYPTDALAALRWKQRTGRPVVFSYMGIPHHQSLANRRHRKEIVLQAGTQADATVALSQVAREGFARWLGIDAQVIAPPVALDAFRPGSPDERDPDGPLVLCAGDHTQPRKRVGLLAEAVGRVDGARLAVSRVRGAPAPSWDGARTIELDLDDSAALAAANRRAHVHALPSEGEAFGLVLAEALACGTPVVGTQPEVVGGEDTGRLVSGRDADELAQALREAIALAGRGQPTIDACRARAQRWSREACAEAYEALYARVLAGCGAENARLAHKIRTTPSGAGG